MEALLNNPLLSLKVFLPGSPLKQSNIYTPTGQNNMSHCLILNQQCLNILVSLPHHVATRKSFNKLKTTCKLKLRAFTYFSKWKGEGALICPSNPMNIISQICGISSYYTVMLKEGTSIKLGIRNPSNEERCT